MTRRSKEITTNGMEGERKFVVQTNTEIMYLTLTWDFFQAITCVHWFFWMAYQEHYVRARKENNHFNLRHL